jgi:PAS domain S-box-containing protein
MAEKPTYQELLNKIQALEAERQRFAQCLHESESTIGSIFKAAPTGIGMVRNRVITQANDRLCQLTGYNRDELIGQNARLLYPTDRDFDFVGEEKYRQIRSKGTGTVETRWRRKNGEILDILLSSTPLDPADHVSGVTFTALDITERKRVESKLRHSEQRFRELAELLPQTVFETNPDGRLTFVNKNASRFFGYSSTEFQAGLNVSALVAPDEQARLGRQIKALAGGRRDDSGHKYTARRKDGSTFPVLVYASMSFERDKAAGLRGIIIDMTRQDKLTRERDKFKEQYIQAQKMEAIGLLAGGVAHDFNNLLSPILGYGEMLLNTLRADDPKRESIEEIYSAGLRAKNLIRQLLAFGRKQTLDIQYVDLNRILTGFESLLHRVLRENIRLQWQLADDLPGVLADAGQIEQIVMNLAINAQDAMPDGGHLSIATQVVELTEMQAAFNQTVKPGSYVLLVFSDTGHGIDADDRQRIFEPFFTTKAQGKGTGLGLATVYGIVKQHQGHIWVYSEPGKGAVFKIYLPVARQADHRAAPSPAGQHDHVGTETIMIAEDDEAVRNLAEYLLRQHGYQVMAAASAKDCLQALSDQAGRVDLLLTDVVLPDTNGKELFDQAQALRSNLKVLYMSGYTENMIAQHGVLEKGVVLLQKPFSVRELIAKVRQVLDGAENPNRAGH